MTKYDAAWAKQHAADLERLARDGLYRAEDERDACGVGFVVAIDGKPSRAVVENGIRALSAIWHRGAVDADGKTGDGAGIHVQIPVEFFDEQVRRTGHAPRGERLAIGQIFLPRNDFAAQEAARTIVEAEVLKMGHYIYGWRHVPVDTSCLGEKANATRPEIEQILISNAKGVDEEQFERELYVIRRRIEKAGAGIRDFYICSMSCRSMIYKGMMLAEDVSVFYPDLQDPRFVSAFAIYHQRYSTNTFPRWWLAQPFRMLAHNGEINTLKGNLNWMRSHEIRMSSDYFGEQAEDIKPIVQANGSDSAALDNVFEVLVRAGRSAPMAKSMLVPEAWSKIATKMPEAWVSMYAYSNAVMEPWDGPAALAMTDGRWVCGGLDRNGLRPMRYVVSGDGLLIAGSEAGMVPTDPMTVVEKGALGPGQMIGVDMATGQLFHDSEIKDMMSASQPFQDWVGSVTDLDAITSGVEERPLYEAGDLRRRQIAAGYTVEELEVILSAMAEDGKEAIGSMGDDTPPAVLSDKYRPLSHYFRQNFSQVTNPPIDSLREHRVMSLKTRFGNLKNVLDQDNSQTEILQLESPFVSNGGFAAMVGQFGDAVVDIDCTFPRRRAERARRGPRAHPRRGRGGRARRREPHRAQRLQPGRGPRRDADDPRDLGRPFLADPQGPAHLHLDQRPRGRVHRPALLRGADRLRGHDGERLPRRGFHRGPDRPRADRGHAVRGRRALPGGHRPGPAEDHVQDGHLGDLVLSRRAELRGRGPQPRDGRRVLPRHGEPHLRHRRARPAAPDRARPCPRLPRRRGAADRRLLQGAALRRGPCLGGEGHAHAAGRLRPRRLQAVEAVLEGDAVAPADQPARPAGLHLQADPGCARRRGEHHVDPQALRHPRHVARRARAGGAQDAEHRDEPDRREVRFGRGRRGSGAFPADAERRQRVRQDQAGRVRPLRRHRRVPEPVRGARDQGRAGRQARRGRPASRHQGHRADRAAAPLDAGRHADLAAAAPRHLLDRGSRAADL